MVAGAGGVRAAHEMLSSTDSQEALGLLWSLSAIPGTLDQFTNETLVDIVRIGRTGTAQDGWRQTAALSALHNLLCYSGYGQVLKAGALEFAVEALDVGSIATLGAQAAAALFLDQCCFDVRSKLPAVEALRLPVLVGILNRSRAAAKGARDPGAPPDAHKTRDEHEVLLGHVLSLLWNASDDVFFSDPKAWARFTARICQPSLVEIR